MTYGSLEISHKRRRDGDQGRRKLISSAVDSEDPGLDMTSLLLGTFLMSFCETASQTLNGRQPSLRVRCSSHLE